MIVVAARPSMGKTSFMMNIVEHVAISSGKPAMVFSCEMSAFQIVQRLVFSRSKFAMSQLSRGYTPNKGDLQRIQRAAMETTASKLFIDDTAGISINELILKLISYYVVVLLNYCFIIFIKKLVLLFYI